MNMNIAKTSPTCRTQSTSESMTYTTTYCVNQPGLIILVSRIFSSQAHNQNISYKIIIKNNGALRNAPKFYTNKSMLARKIYQKMSDMNFDIIGRIPTITR